MQTRSSDEKAVSMSVRQTDCNKTEEKSVQIFIPYERSFSIVFWEKGWLVGWPLLPEIFGSTGSRWSEIADFEPIFARSASALNSYEISLCENCQRQSCTAFICLISGVKMIDGGAIPSTWNFGSKWRRWSEIADFRIIFARSASAVTPSEKSSINTNRTSTTRFPMSPR